MARILVLGSVAQDQVIHLRTALREGAHLDGSEAEPRLGGGAANTGAALAHAGHQVMPVCPIGDDATGRWLREQLEANGLDLSLVRTIEGPSTRSLVMIDPQGERTIINLNRAREPGPPERILAIDVDCLFVRSSAPDLAPLLRAKAETCRVIAHMPPCETLSRPAHILVASNSDLTDEQLQQPFELGREVGGELVQWVVITRGAEGASAYSASEALHIEAPQIEPVDTTGAGDAFAAGLVQGLVSGYPMAAAVRLGCAYGAEATLWDASMLPAQAVARLLAQPGIG